MSISQEKFPGVPAGIGESSEGVQGGCLSGFPGPVTTAPILLENEKTVNFSSDEGAYDPDDFRLGFYTNARESRRIVCDLMSELRKAWSGEDVLPGGEEGYISMFAFMDGDYIDGIRQTGSARKSSVVCRAPFLVFDIDRRGDLPAAAEDTRKLTDYLVSQGLSYENIQIWFSGMKGLHCCVPIQVFGESAHPSERFNDVCRKVAEMIAEQVGIVIDTQIYDITRQIRRPNSRHNESRSYKIPVSYTELIRADAIEFICKRAESRRGLQDVTEPVYSTPGGNDDVKYNPETEPVLEHLWQAAERDCANTVVPSVSYSPPEEELRDSLAPQEMRRVIHYLNKMPEAVEGHGGDKTLFTVACRLVQGWGLTPGVAEEIIMKHYNPKCKPPWSEQDVRYKCESAVKYGGNRPAGYLWDEAPAPAEEDAHRWTNRRDPATFKPFPVHCLPDPVRQYVTEKARSLNQDPAGLAFALLVQAGAHVGACVELQLGNDWHVYPILWFSLIGISGSGKSPLLSSGMNLVDAKDDEYYQVYKKEQQAYEAALKEYKRKTAKPKEVCEPPPLPPRRRKYVVTNATIEGLLQDIEENPRGIFLFYDELATFFGDTERSQRIGSASEWLSGYNGAKVSSSRAGAKEIYIPKALWAVLGASTPEKLEGILRKGNRLSDGTLSRFCMLWPPEVEERSHDDVSLESMNNMQEILQSLMDVDFVGKEPHRIYLDEDAKKIWREWQDEIFRKKSNTHTDAESSFLGKSEEWLARIALILHLLENAADPKIAESRDYARLPTQRSGLYIPDRIGAETMRKAEIITRWIIGETWECYQLFGFIQTPGVKDEEILEIIRNAGKPMTLRDIGQKKSSFRKSPGKEQVSRIIDKLVAEGRLRCEETPRTNGTPAKKYSLTS